MRHITLTALFLTIFGLFSNAQPAAQGATPGTNAQGPAAPAVAGQTIGDPASLSGGRITGDIIDNKGQALEAVTVTLLRVGDFARVKETVTNKGGHFVLSDSQTENIWSLHLS